MGAKVGAAAAAKRAHLANLIADAAARLNQPPPIREHGLTEEERLRATPLQMVAVEAVALGVVAGLAFCAFVGIGFPGWLS